MGRVTEEMKVQINELYLQLGVKSHVAKQLGISSSTVTKYLIPNYVSIKNQQQITCAATPAGADDFVNSVFKDKNYKHNFINLTQLTADEVEELKNFQKEFVVYDLF